MKERLYIGSYSDNIIICELDNGNLYIVNKIKGIKNPSYLHINKDVLYAVSETDKGSIVAFEIQENDLYKISEQSLKQSLPCYITTNITRDKILIANYGSGAICMYNLKENGVIGDEYAIAKILNSHMHFAKFQENYIYAIDLGNDNIYLYNNKLELLYTIATNAKSGPRHAAFLKDMLYVITEMSNQILVYKKNNEKFELIQEISTLSNKKVESYAGAIKISKDGKNIYVTNRGDNTISVFSINNNKLALIQNISSYGDFPRDIFINETDEYVIVANQKSNNLVTFKRNLENGILIKLKNADVLVDSPSCIIGSNYEK